MASAKETFHKVWYFIWEDNSIWSWLVNIVLAFVIIKFLVYPGLGFALGTTHPIVAVVSGSMEHKSVKDICVELGPGAQGPVCIKYSDTLFSICGKQVPVRKGYGLDDYYGLCGDWYSEKNITMDDFKGFQMKNGFNKGDIIVLRKAANLKVGDIIVFWSADRPDPIIHRIVRIDDTQYGEFIQTKGDHNGDSSPIDMNIPSDKVIGKAFFKLPYLGYIKIGFVELLRLVRVI